jgi:short-subunit dehydrogenase
MECCMSRAEAVPAGRTNESAPGLGRETETRTRTYAGSKAWVVMATDGLRDALAGTPVRVLCVIPGFTRSEFHARAGVDPSGVPRWLWLTPATVAREALAALAAGRGTCVPGRRYRALLAVLGPLPPRLRRAALRRVARLRPADLTCD